MPRIDPPSCAASLPWWWKPAALIAVAGVLAFAIWTVPNWGEFWSNVGQFPGLWQIPTNRRIIIDLVIKVASPLLIMGIVGVMVWMYFLLKPSQDDGVTDENVSREHVLQEALTEQRIPRATSPAKLSQKPQTREGSFSSHALAQPVAVSQHYNPETPLPPTLSLPEALQRQADESPSSATSSTGGQHALLADQSGESSTVEGALPAAPPFQLAGIALPGAWGSEHLAPSDRLLSLRLLKDVSMVINVPGGGHVVVPLSLNAKRVQLLAYIAWRRGELIDRDKILEHVFGWGLADEEATEDKLSERFESHKKLLRKKIREVVVEHVNKPAGRQVIDPGLDPFMSDSGFWGLSESCRVEDLEAIEASYKAIALARKDGKLGDEIPEYVKEACERLIASYPGDFLESLIKKYPSEFRPWQGRSSWARKPYTHYRDYYLEALWYAAEYEWRMGQRCIAAGDAEMEEAKQRTQQESFGRAAQRYQSYAMYACNSRFDAKATFGAHGEVGERIGMSERALRRCVVLLGAIGRTDLVNQVWSAYSTQMKSISDQRWQPSQETQADVQAARAQTNAYRFAAQASHLSSAFAERQDRVS